MNEPRAYEVRFKCKCMQREGSIHVRFRRSNEDISDFMNMVQMELTREHQKRSPLCRSTKLEYAKLPAPDNAPYIGGKPKLDA